MSETECQECGDAPCTCARRREIDKADSDDPTWAALHILTLEEDEAKIKERIAELERQLDAARSPGMFNDTRCSPKLATVCLMKPIWNVRYGAFGEAGASNRTMWDSIVSIAKIYLERGPCQLHIELREDWQEIANPAPGPDLQAIADAERADYYGVEEDDAEESEEAEADEDVMNG